MAEELRLETHAKPSGFNQDTLVGALIGFAMPGGLITAAIGAVIGGVIGKKQMEDEEQHGKKVSSPNPWNKEALIGGLTGYIASTFVEGIVATAVIASTGTIGVGAAIGLMAIGLAGPVIGGLMGSKAGERRQEIEYEVAKQQTIARHLGGNSSPEMGNALDAVEMPTKSWAQDIAQKRMSNTAQHQR